MSSEENDLISLKSTIEGEVIKRGAEAKLLKSKWLDLDAIYKVRVEKKYRHPVIDVKLRKERTVGEARIMAALIDIDVPVPALYDVYLDNYCIVMEFIEGKRVKDILNDLGDQDVNELFKQIGYEIGKMHQRNIIHGDLTTSNILYTGNLKGNSARNARFCFIDFGLSGYSTSIEDKSVDLHLFKRVISSTHASKFDQLYQPLVQGYKEYHVSNAMEDQFNAIMKRIEKIEARGRYVKKEKRN